MNPHRIIPGTRIVLRIGSIHIITDTKAKS
jgi:hypothetical protein